MNWSPGSAPCCAAARRRNARECLCRRRRTRPRAFGPLSIDVAGRQVFIDDEPVLLTRTEFDVLAALSSRPAVVFSRRQLLESVDTTRAMAAVFVAALTIGIPLSTLALLLVVLACPLMMMFMKRGMGGGHENDTKHDSSDTPDHRDPAAAVIADHRLGGRGDGRCCLLLVALVIVTTLLFMAFGLGLRPREHRDGRVMSFHRFGGGVVHRNVWHPVDGVSLGG